MLAPLNVVESNLALLHEAELSQASGDKAAARASLDEFKKAWPNASTNEALARRIKTLGMDP
jgi:TolA-binding protein